jgi:hypothetical protein
VRAFEKVKSVPGASEQELARDFAQRGLWPHYVERRAGSRIDAHYHAADEELQVCRGAITFFDVRTAATAGIELNVGDRMRIPEGTIHSAIVGDDGVDYVMGVSEPIPLDEFAIYLPVSPEAPLQAVAGLIEDNYHFSEAEEAGAASSTFFDEILSDRFVFVGAGGDQSMRRADFIDGLEKRKGRGRRSAGLRLHFEDAAVLASIIVTTDDGGRYLNARLFEKDSSARWRCVRWANAQARAPKATP